MARLKIKALHISRHSDEMNEPSLDVKPTHLLQITIQMDRVELHQALPTL
jgi:hypothetical protein